MDLTGLRLNLISNTILGIIFLPFSLYVLKGLLQNRKALFDDDLTAADRRQLKQIAIFVLLPIIVLLHELGHVIACMHYGVHITGFNWSLFWGEVSWKGPYPEGAPAVIALAGTVFQLIAGAIALIIAFLSKSPSIVALSTYTYLLSGLSSLIFYPVISLVSWSEDFPEIYGSGDPKLVWLTAIVHLILAWGFVYSYFSNRTRLLFVKKTRPIWAREYEKNKAAAEKEGNAMAYLALAWQYYYVGLDNLSEKTIQKAEAIDESNLDVWLLRGYIMQSQNKFDTADICFSRITDGNADTTLKARAYMARGHCYFEKESEKKSKDLQRALDSYKQAALSAKDLADPHYYLAVVHKEAGRPEEAADELRICLNAQKQGLNWLDPVLANLAREAFQEFKKTAK